MHVTVKKMEVSASSIYNVPILSRKKEEIKMHTIGLKRGRKTRLEIRFPFTGMSDVPFTVRTDHRHTAHR